jgi:hypothetical protein
MKKLFFLPIIFLFFLSSTQVVFADLNPITGATSEVVQEKIEASKGSLTDQLQATITAEQNKLQEDTEKLLIENLKSIDLQVDIPGFNPEAAVKNSYLEKKQDGNFYFTSSILTEYIITIFQYAIYVIGILAVILIIFSGFQWMISGGNKATIQQAIQRIQRSIIAVLIAVSSYTLLTAIDSNLILLKNLKLLTIVDNNSSHTVITDNTMNYHNKIKSLLDSIKKPTWTTHTFDCDNPPPEAGVTPKNLLKTYTCPIGIIGNFTVIPEMKEGVCKVGQLADSKGYAIKVYSSYRSYERQVKIWCTSSEPIATRRSIIALPGFSNHGNGIAIDVVLRKKGNPTNLTGGLSSKGQCSINQEYIKVLSEIFYEADFNFVRLETEIWHFEYGTKDLIPKRNWYNSYPKRCTGKESSISNLNFQRPIFTESPASSSNKCTFTEKRWNKQRRRSEIFRQEQEAPYNQITTEEPNYISKIDPRCSICEEDQVNITINGKTIKICWAYADQAKQILNEAKNNGFNIKELIGYRPLRSGGALDNNGFYSGVGGHFYGMAIDVNRNYNGLYNGCSTWDIRNNPKGPLPNGCTLNIGGKWDPNKNEDKTIFYGSPIYNAFTSKGWKWGGIDFGNGHQRDFMDFTIYGYDFSN